MEQVCLGFREGSTERIEPLKRKTWSFCTFSSQFSMSVPGTLADCSDVTLTSG